MKIAEHTNLGVAVDEQQQAEPLSNWAPSKKKNWRSMIVRTTFKSGFVDCLYTNAGTLHTQVAMYIHRLRSNPYVYSNM